MITQLSKSELFSSKDTIANKFLSKKGSLPLTMMALTNYRKIALKVKREVMIQTIEESCKILNRFMKRKRKKKPKSLESQQRTATS